MYWVLNLSTAGKWDILWNIRNKVLRLWMCIHCDPVVQDGLDCLLAEWALLRCSEESLCFSISILSPNRKHSWLPLGFGFPCLVENQRNLELSSEEMLYSLLCLVFSWCLLLPYTHNTCVHTHVPVHAEARAQPWLLFHMCLFMILIEALSLAWSLPSRLGLLASKSRGNPVWYYKHVHPGLVFFPYGFCESDSGP